MTAVVTDMNQFAGLRAMADRNDPEALREVAGQFEALFLQMMMKNMRAASFGDPIMGDNKQHELYQDLMDKQLALEMASGPGIGMADMIVRQLGGDVEPVRPSDDVTPLRTNVNQTRAFPISGNQTTDEQAVLPNIDPPTVATLVDDKPSRPSWDNPESFAEAIWPHVKTAAKALNVSPIGILAQAALETGWGQHVMQDSSGDSSLNLFGIKAGNNWSGDAVARKTLEFDGQVARHEVAKFRSYKDLDQTLQDYTSFIANNPRYESVKNSDPDSFANALQSSGYATDPKYAEKIMDIFNGPTMKRVLTSLGAATGN